MTSFKRVLIFGIALPMAIAAQAGVLTLAGSITQSMQDGTGPAVNNPALNGILDGSAYSVSVSFTGSVTGPGSYHALSDAAVVFSDGSILEVAFTSADLTVLADANPARYDISFLGCLNTGSGCFIGNSLSANFSVAISDFNSSNSLAGAVTGLYPPLDLLEDDGATDIQATITRFSNPGVAAVPEPASGAAVLFGFGLLLMARFRK